MSFRTRLQIVEQRAEHGVGQSSLQAAHRAPSGLGMAKDIWMLSTGLALVLDGLIDDTKGAAKSTKKTAKKKAKAAKKALPVG